MFLPTEFGKPSLRKTILQDIKIMATAGLVVGVTGDIAAASFAKFVIDPIAVTNTVIGFRTAFLNKGIALQEAEALRFMNDNVVHIDVESDEKEVVCDSPQ